MSDDEQRTPIPGQPDGPAGAGSPDHAPGAAQPPEPAVPPEPAGPEPEKPAVSSEPDQPAEQARAGAEAEPAEDAQRVAESEPVRGAPAAQPPEPIEAVSSSDDAPEDAEAGDGGRPARSRRRLSAAGAFIGVLLGLLGFALAVQLRSNASDAQLNNERPEDLVQILSDLDSRQERLRLEISNLQSTKQQLQAGSQSREAALQAATQHANELGILAGTLAAQGPGVVIRVQAGKDPVKASTILDMVEELRDAGAEAMQIEGAGGAVRIVASTYFVDGESGRLEVDGTQLAGPYTLTVIGDPPTLQPALNIAGGVADVVRSAGGTVTVTTPGTVTVSALATVSQPKYAKPVK